MKTNNNKFESNKKYFTISIYAFCVLVAAILFNKFIGNWEATTSLFKSIIRILSPFLIAFLIAYLFYPMINWVELNIMENIKIGKYKIKHLKTKRVLSIIIVYIIVLGLLTLTLVYVIPQMATSINDVFERTQKYLNSYTTSGKIYKFIEDILIQYPTIDVNAIQNAINSYFPDIVTEVRNFLTDTIPFLYNLGLSVLASFINILLALVIAFYLITEKELFLAKGKKIIYAFIAEEKANGLIQIIKHCHEIIAKFVIGKALDSLIIGVLCFIILVIANMPYALLISVIIGITNMIPYFGPFIGAVPGFLMVFIRSPIKSFWFLVIILALQQFDGIYLGPKILGDSTGLSPFWVIFSIIVGGALFGAVGMFLGVPFLGVLNYLLTLAINKRLANKNLTIESTNERN
jgi:predicted PurR-regulated permease PerM